MNKTLIVFHNDRYIELPLDKNLSLDNTCRPVPNGLIKISCEGEGCTVNGILLMPFKKAVIGNFSWMLFEDERSYYSTVNTGMIRIGNGNGCQIILDDQNIDVTLAIGRINVMSGEVYHNGKLLRAGNYVLTYGDCLLVGSTKITVKDGYLVCNGIGYNCSLNIAVNVPERFADFPVYKRSPRIIKREPQDKIDFISPPQKEKRKKGQLIKMIVPPMVMLCIIIAVSFLMKRGIFVIISVAGMMMSLIFSITTFFSDKKERKEKETERVQGYETYLLDQRKKLFCLYNKQKESLLFHNSSIMEIESMIHNYSSRLYERAANDSDFLCVSLGYSNVLSTYKVKYNNDSLEMQKDELRDEMNDVVNQFVTLPDMPVVIDFKKAHLGIVGEKKYVHEELKALLVQLCFSQSYHDIEIITLIEETDMSEFEWIKWYPHCKVKNINISGLVSGENQRDQVLGNIAQVLKARKQKKDEEKKESIYLPHYIFIVDSPKLIINHSIMEYLQGESLSLGFSLIYTTNIQANLPENIKTILLLDGKDNGTLLMNEGVLLKQALKPHQLDNVDLESMARRLAPMIHNKGVTTQIPDSITFYEMYQIKKPQELPIQQLWKQ
ncbi:MAG: type VII secretion protein EssC, partial [Oscillospiraceae bacterium]